MTISFNMLKKSYQRIAPEENTKLQDRFLSSWDPYFNYLDFQMALSGKDLSIKKALLGLMNMFDSDQSCHTPLSQTTQMFISQFPEGRLPAVRETTLEYIKMKVFSFDENIELCVIKIRTGTYK